MRQNNFNNVTNSLVFIIKRYSSNNIILCVKVAEDLWLVAAFLQAFFLIYCMLYSAGQVKSATRRASNNKIILSYFLSFLATEKQLVILTFGLVLFLQVVANNGKYNRVCLFSPE